MSFVELCGSEVSLDRFRDEALSGYSCLVFLVEGDMIGMDVCSEVGGLDDVVCGCVLRPGSVGELKGLLGGVRGEVDFVCVVGDDGDVGRAAVSDRRVDLLLRPDRCDVLEPVVARLASENDVGVGFDLKPLLRWSGYKRSLFIRRLRKEVFILDKYDVSTVVSFIPGSIYDLKYPRDFKSILNLVDLDGGLLGRSSSFILDRVRYNRQFEEDGFIEPGIEVIDKEKHRPNKDRGSDGQDQDEVDGSDVGGDGSGCL